MSVFHDIQRITLKVYLTIKVHLVECLHWDLGLAMVLTSMLLAVELQVVLHRAAGIFRLLILAWGDARGNVPESHQNWDRGEEAKEEGRPESAADLAGGVPGDDEDECEHDDIVEGVAACGVGGEGGIFDCWVL